MDQPARQSPPEADVSMVGARESEPRAKQSQARPSCLWAPAVTIGAVGSSLVRRSMNLLFGSLSLSLSLSLILVQQLARVFMPSSRVGSREESLVSVWLLLWNYALYVALSLSAVIFAKQYPDDLKSSGQYDLREPPNIAHKRGKRFVSRCA